MLSLKRGPTRINDAEFLAIAKNLLHARFLSRRNALPHLQKDLSGTRNYASKAVKTKKTLESLPKRLREVSGTSLGQLDVPHGSSEAKRREETLDHLPRESELPERARRKRAKACIQTEQPELNPDPSTKAPRRRRKQQSTTEDIKAGYEDVGSQESKDVEQLIESSQTSSISNYKQRGQLASEIQSNLAQFPHCILLTRIGQFYESYFDQAQEVAQLLSIKLTSRTWDGQRVWMCGFPLAQLDKHLKTLIQQHGRSVAMCEEFRKPQEVDEVKYAKPSFERRVTRIITPGTLIDESFLNPVENNFLLAVYVPLSNLGTPNRGAFELGLAWIDVSTGEFFTASTSYDELEDHLVRIDPQEIVLDGYLKSLPSHPLHSKLQEANCPVSYIEGASRLDGSGLVTGHSNVILSQDIQTETGESAATNLLNNFLKMNLLEFSPKKLELSREERSGYLQIDAHTLKALEIIGTSQVGRRVGSLKNSIKRTVTSAGTRLLTRWLCSPSTCREEILFRQNLVELMCTRLALRMAIVDLLKDLEDAAKIMQKLSLGKGAVGDLMSVHRCIDTWNNVKRVVETEKALELDNRGSEFKIDSWKSIDILMGKLANLEKLAIRIDSAVGLKDSAKQASRIDLPKEENLTTQAAPPEEGLDDNSDAIPEYFIKPQFSSELENLHTRYHQLESEKEGLQTRLRDQYDALSLTLRHSATYGMHVHVSKARRDVERIEKYKQFAQLAESKSTKVFFNQEWFALGHSILATKTDIARAERVAFSTLRDEIKFEDSAVRRNAEILATLDVTCSFATLGLERNYVRPIIKDGLEFNIQNGRHPTVELGLLKNGKTFTANTLAMADQSRLHLITGPNMGGKSTFLRQTALIAILAQAGSFVPADFAEIGLIDKIFSRVGAKDDLFRDRSTFMVEMLETADILKNATNKSLVIMDEVGRGTTVKDGFSIAFATTHHLYHINRCRALFATHFHEMVDMLGFSEETSTSTVFPGIKFSCTEIEEDEFGRFSYSHRMKPGVNRDSHGLKVAQLAGMPLPALEVAKEILSVMKAPEGNKDQGDSGMSMSIVFSDLGKRFASLSSARGKEESP